MLLPLLISGTAEELTCTGTAARASHLTGHAHRSQNHSGILLGPQSGSSRKLEPESRSLQDKKRAYFQSPGSIYLSHKGDKRISELIAAQCLLDMKDLVAG